jgi:membrane associated rhomboid family serine protease
MGFEFENQQREAESPRQMTDHPPAFSTLPIYTSILLACIGIVFLAQFMTSNDPQFFAIDRVSAYYAGFDKQAFLNGEYWRALTGAFVHSGLLHVGMNAYALYSFGRLIELLSNRAHVAIVFVLAALGGDLLSLLFNPDATSVGASGGIVGFLSYLAVYAFKRREFISREFRKSLLVNIGFILVFGFVLFGIVDNYGHIGGLVVGAIYGMVQIPRDQYIDPRVAGRLTKLIGIAALFLVIVTTILTVVLLMNGASHPANA